MDILLSIRPKHIKAIAQGKKKYEFRKVRFRNIIDRVYIYATYPTQRIVGYFGVGKIVEGHPDRLWETLYQDSGMDKGEFSSYYGNYKYGFAIEIKQVVFFDTPINPKELIHNFIPPQSFRYITSETVGLVHKN